MISLGVLPNHDGFETIAVGVADDLEIQGRFVRLKRPIKITLDGIAKGYAVDAAVKVMKSMGVRSGWVNAGGDLRVFGSIQLPVQRREISGMFTNLGSFSNAAIATSSVSDRMDPSFPGAIVGADAQQPNLGCWTVVAKSTWLADAFTKVAALASGEQLQQMLTQLGCQLFPPARLGK